MTIFKHSAVMALGLLAVSAVHAGDVPFEQKTALLGRFGGEKSVPYGENFLLIMKGNRGDVLKRIAPDKLKKVGKLTGMRINDSILADVNGDGLKDIVCAGYVERISGGEHTQEGVGGVYLNSEKGFAKSPEILEADDAVNGRGVAVGDIDGDGIDDLIFSIRKGGIAVMAGVKGDIPEDTLVFDPKIKAVIVAADDFDGDGVAEIAVAHFQAKHKILKYDRQTKKLVQVWASASKGQSPSILVTTDLNGDGKPDLIQGGRGFWDRKKVQIFLSGKNEKYFNAKPDFGYTPSSDELTDMVKSILVDDLNGDGKPDLILGLSGHETKADFGGKTFFLLNDGTGKFTPSATVFKGGCELALFDIDGDGAKDLLSNTPYHPRLKRIKLDANNLYVNQRKK